MPNNYQRLKEEADIATVIAHLQIPVTKRGNAYFIPCPNPNHQDDHATNCYFKEGWNNVYCWVCGKSIQAIDLIMDTLGYDYGEAADYLWELEGRPDWYYIKEGTQKKPSFSLTREEAELIGLHPTGKAILPERMLDYKEKLPAGKEYYQKELGGYLECGINRIRWQDLITEKQYLAMVKNKCIETRKRLSKQLKNLQSMESAFLEFGIKDKHLMLFIEACQAQLSECEALYERAKAA